MCCLLLPRRAPVTQFRQLPDPAGARWRNQEWQGRGRVGVGDENRRAPRCFQILAGGGRAPPDTKRREGTREDRERESGEEGLYQWYKH
jgi:hypothetical protein